jgi:predicted deacylase
MSMTVHVLRGRRDGPRLFVSAAMHGDELNGVEIIRRLLRLRVMQKLRGALIAVPIINVYGLIQHSRYLPDRRDLNRVFPGSERGSLAARLAHLFMTEIVSNASHGIDLHTGALHRVNLPQIRADMDNPETARLARSFGVPVVIDASTRDGSLRAEVSARGIPMLLYEAGEALRFDDVAIRAGVRGITNVMRDLGMLPARRNRKPALEPYVADSSSWLRAPQSGMLVRLPRLGAQVAKADVVGVLADPFGESEWQIRSPWAGIVIGRTQLPLVNEGDAILHIAGFEAPHEVAEQLDSFQAREIGTAPEPDPSPAT